jgi:hypothetical protein
MDNDKQNAGISKHELKVLVKALTKSVEYIHKKHIIMTGSTSYKPRLVDEDKGCNEISGAWTRFILRRKRDHSKCGCFFNKAVR